MHLCRLVGTTEEIQGLIGNIALLCYAVAPHRGLPEELLFELLRGEVLLELLLRGLALVRILHI